MQFWKAILAVTFVTIVLAPAAAAATSSTQLLRVMNEARAEHGVGPLRSDAPLRRAARAHSVDMIRTEVFGHNRFVERLQRFGVRGPYVGENLAWGVGGSTEARAIVSSWLASPLHRANLLNARFQRVGLGFASGSFNGYSGATLLTANFAGS